MGKIPVSVNPPIPPKRKEGESATDYMIRSLMHAAWDEGQEHRHSEHCALGVYCNPYEGA